MEKRGQVTVFIIIAIVIIAAAVVVFFIYPRVGPPGVVSETPTEFVQDCMENEISDAVQEISLNGGSSDPEFYHEYYIDGKKYEIEYLCYTNEYYKTCVMQQPMLMQHIEDEIKNAIGVKAEECFDSLEDNYKKKGYSVYLERTDYNVELIPNKIITTFNYDLTLTKGGSDKYDEFEVVLDNKLYDLVSVARDILEWESEYGDSDVRIYMDYYHWLKAEKIKRTDGTTVYILTERDTENKFQFASRSVAWP